MERPADAILTTGMHGLPLLQVVAVGMLILANAFFVAAEFALVSTRDTRIEQLLANKVPGARAVRRLQHDIEYFLPAVQLGVTLCSLAIGWIGEPMAAERRAWLDQPAARILSPMRRSTPTSPLLTAVALGFCLITYFHVTIGELVPKSLALRRAEALAVAVAPPMLIFMQMARPAVRLLKGSAAIILRGFDIPMTERAAVHSPEELKLITTAARRLGLLPRFQETLIHRAIELDDVPVREIMTPRQRIFSLPSNMPVEEASAQVIEHMNSRVPVYDETRGPEHIIGDRVFKGSFAPDVLPSASTAATARTSAAPAWARSSAACGNRISSPCQSAARPSVHGASVASGDARRPGGARDKIGAGVAAGIPEAPPADGDRCG